ncbi:MAG: hypothetical protein MUF18_00285 [Fimbriiglobus sp.]|nr:hypothetical protein [Fimbriiglobus sp.]
MLLAFALWQGGFVFYSAVVVPVGTDLNGAFAQGLVTQRVTHWLNLIGLACHGAYLWHLWATRGALWKWGLWVAGVALLGGLVAAHWRMDALLDTDTLTTADGFRGWHIAYLWGSTAHWAIGLVLAWGTLMEPRPKRGE